jgi:DNA (cytosine-5)-methyltransferase 1
MEELKVLELFAGGIGAFTKALEYENIPFKIIDAVEYDKNAILSYNTIHNTNFEKMDIRNWDKDIGKIDMIAHGSPCTSFSLAGTQEGGDEGSGTQSSLMYESIRIIKKYIPKYIIWENVKNLYTSPKHKHNYQNYLDILSELGYNNYFKVLNAVDFGLPQKRERIFTISIRKDIDDKTFNLDFENKIDCGSYKDYLEENPTDDIYLTAHQCTMLKCYGCTYSFGGYTNYTDILGTITASYGKITGNSHKIIRDPNKMITLVDSVTQSAERSILTPRETLRLMGLKEKDIDLMYPLFERKNALYKIAGNSICIPVLQAIYRKLFKKEEKL